MSPRKTRRGAKSEDVNDTLSETMSKKPEEETPMDSQRKKRTRRQLTKTSSLESEIDQSPEINKSKRKAVRETPPSKTTRSRKKLPLDGSVDESLITANVSTRRTRRGKENETIAEQTMPLDSTTMNEYKADKSRGTRARKKVVKKMNSKDEDETAVTNKRINASAAANVTVLDQGYEDVSSSDSVIPMSIEDNEVHQVSSTISRIKATPGKRRPRNAKLPTEDCTPESSPITVSLTPHRTTKTPRKSPMNLGSPKSHADTSLRLSKTPRKLPIVAESPAPSEKSVTSSTQSTPIKSPILDLLGTSNSKKKHRSLKSKLSPKNERKKSSLVPQRKFSKSPKIVLRSPKAKSPKTKSPRVLASKIRKPSISKRSTKSPVKTKQSPKSSLVAPVLMKSLSPKKAEVSLSPKKSKQSTSPKKAKISLSPLKSRKSLSPKKGKKLSSSTRSIKSPSPKKSIKSPSPRKSIKSPSPRKSVKSLSPKKPSSPRKTVKSPSPKRSLKTASPSKLSDSPGNRMTVHLARVDSTTPTTKSPTRSRNTESKQVIQSPTVLLNKITPENTPVTSTKTRRNTPNDESVKNTPLKTQSAEKRPSQGAISPRRPKSAGKKRGPITDSGTPLRPIGTPRGSVTKLSAGKSMIISSSSTPVDIARAKLGSGGRILSSTPRERIRRSLNLSPGLSTTLGVMSSPMNGATPAGSSTLINEGRVKRRSFRIEDESNPLISEDESNPLISGNECTKEKSTSQTRLNGTYEVEATVVAEKEEEKPGNGTYELAEPKTPNLRRKAAKRSAEDLDTSNEERPVKRTCRVRFASPSPDDAENKAAEIGPSRLATPGIRSAQKVDSARRVSVSSISTNDKFRRRSNSMGNTSMLKTPIAKRRSNSVTDGGVKSASRREQNASVNRLSKPRLSITSSTKKQENKTPIARKAPNFAQIHQRKFAKMESLVDAKKRVAKRHIAMTSQIPTILTKAVNKTASPKQAVPAKVALPTAPVNGAYNRYGFKLRKNDAVKMMTQKQQTHASDKKMTENRNLLKGVRTNRRFDLIMKARNINQ